MTKLVLKTVAITLVAVLGAGMILFGSLALFAPLSVANFFDGMGMQNVAVKYYEKQYGKSESVEDLAVLILKLDEESDSVKSEKYLKIMIEKDEYSSYCQAQDSINNGGKVSQDEYYKGKYALSLVRNEKFDVAVSVAKDYVLENGYTDYNPFSVIIAELGMALTDAQLNTIKTEILNYKSSNQDAAISADLTAIEQLLG